MVIPLTHPFVYRCSDSVALLLDCDKVNTYCNRLEKQSAASVDPDKYKGDGLELLVECLIRLYPADRRIAITDYKIASDNKDTGVDGVGKGMNGKPATVQVKYRQANYLLTANQDHLSNFVAASWKRFGVPMDDTDNMLIVTTGEGMHHFTKAEMMYGSVRVINRNHLRKLLDKNDIFWNSFRESWATEIEKIRAAKLI